MTENSAPPSLPSFDLGDLDHVTGRPTRQRFVKDCEAQIHHRAQSIVLITLSDARQFNELLRALGHDCADDFVRAGAALIAGVIGPQVKLYHVSVLSFAILIDMHAGQSTAPLAKEIQKAFAEPVLVQTIPIKTRLGIGIVSWEVGSKPGEALRAALAAAQDSRLSQKDYAFYDPKSDNAHRRAFRLLRDLESALQSGGQLALHYQPRLELVSQRCFSAEALLRWTHPEFGPISSGEFVPLAEATALISPLTDWVLSEAIRQSAAFVRIGHAIRISVNVSPLNLQDRYFVTKLEESLVRHRLDPGGIEIEITEGAIATGDDPLKRQMNAIRDCGISIAIDDFGTGYSSLSYLVDVPADLLKLDRSFLRSIRQDERRRLLLASIIDLAHALGLRVVVEGVEDLETMRLVQNLGCDEVQGFYVGRPMRAKDFSEHVQQSHAYI